MCMYVLSVYITWNGWYVNPYPFILVSGDPTDVGTGGQDPACL